jgi:hypothetical protein
MTDKPPDLITKYSVKQPPEHDKKAFSIIPSNTGEIMLDVRLKTSDCFGMPYSYLMGIAFDASGILTLFFTTHTFTIKGRNLRPVYEGLLRHTVTFIQEANPDYDESDESETFISAIEVQEAGQ